MAEFAFFASFNLEHDGALINRGATSEKCEKVGVVGEEKIANFDVAVVGENDKESVV